MTHLNGRPRPLADSCKSCRSLTLEFEEGTANVEWLGQSRQVEVSVAVLGSKGRMRALTPCIIARGPALKLVLEELAPVSEEGEGEYDGSGFDEAGNATPGAQPHPLLLRRTLCNHSTNRMFSCFLALCVCICCLAAAQSF